MTHKEIITYRMNKLNTLKLKYPRILDNDRAKELFDRLLINGDREALEEIKKGYMLVLINYISGEFLNCDASINDLLNEAIKGLAEAIRTVDKRDCDYYEWVVKHVEKAIVDYFVSNNKRFYPVADLKYYTKRSDEQIIGCSCSLFEKGKFYSNLFLNELMKPGEIGEKYGYTKVNILNIIKRTLLLFDPKTLKLVQEILDYPTRGQSYIMTIYDFFGDHDVERVRKFLAMLPFETYEIILSFYPFNRNEETDKESILKKYGYNGNTTYNKLSKIKRLYKDYLMRKPIHPYYLYLFPDIKKINIFHSFPDIDPNIVREAISLLVITYQDFTYYLYDDRGNFRRPLSNVVSELGNKGKAFLDKFYKTRSLIKDNIRVLMNGTSQPATSPENVIPSESLPNDDKRISFTLLSESQS